MTAKTDAVKRNSGHTPEHVSSVRVVPIRHGAPSRGKRIAQSVALQLAPVIDAVIAGRSVPQIDIRFERKGFSDGVSVSVRVTK